MDTLNIFAGNKQQHTFFLSLYFNTFRHGKIVKKKKNYVPKFHVFLFSRFHSNPFLEISNSLSPFRIHFLEFDTFLFFMEMLLFCCSR